MVCVSIVFHKCFLRNLKRIVHWTATVTWHTCVPSWSGICAKRSTRSYRGMCFRTFTTPRAADMFQSPLWTTWNMESRGQKKWDRCRYHVLKLPIISQFVSTVSTKSPTTLTTVQESFWIGLFWRGFVDKKSARSCPGMWFRVLEHLGHVPKTSRNFQKVSMEWSKVLITSQITFSRHWKIGILLTALSNLYIGIL